MLLKIIFVIFYLTPGIRALEFENVMNKTEQPEELVNCEGIFRNGSIEIWMLKRYADADDKTRPPSVDICEKCGSLIVRVQDDELDWTKVQKASLPNLYTYELHVTTKLTPKQFVQKAGWSNLLLFKYGHEDNKVRFTLTINNVLVLEFRPISKYLKIDWIVDPSSILDTVGEVTHLTLGHCKLNNLDAVNTTTLKSLTFENVEYPTAIDYIRRCHSLETLSISKLTAIENIDICQGPISNSKNLATVYINKVSVKCDDANFTSTPINTLVLQNCTGSLVEVNWRTITFPNLTNLAIVGHEPKSSAKLLWNIKIDKLNWIYFSKFDSKTPTPEQVRVAESIQSTRGDLKGDEENFILKKVSGHKWQGWTHDNGKEGNLLDFESLIRRAPPALPYRATHIDIQVDPDIDSYEGRSIDRLKAHIQEFKVWDTYLADGAVLSLTQAWRDNRNVSFTIDGNVLLNITQSAALDVEISVSKINATAVLKNSKKNQYGGGKLTKLALKDVQLDDIGLVEWAELKEVVFSGVKFDEISISRASKDLETFSLSYWSPRSINLDVTKDLGSKQLRRLALRNVNLALRGNDSVQAVPVFEKMEELYLCNCEWDKAFENILWKAFPNLRKLSVIIPEDDQMDSILLKTMLKNWTKLEWLYIVGFNWESKDPVTDKEIEKFVNLEFEDGELKVDFLLKKNTTGNGKWKARKINYNYGEPTDLYYELYHQFQNYRFHSTLDSSLSYEGN